MGSGHETQDPRLSDASAAAEKMPGLFPGKWVICYRLISASKIGLKIASAAEAFFFSLCETKQLLSNMALDAHGTCGQRTAKHWRLD